MKRLLFIVVMGFAVLQLANAQVIELIGQGVVGVNPSTLLIPDNGPVEKVVVVAAALFYGNVPADPKAITFSDADESYTVNFNKTDPTILLPYLANDPNLAFGYYTATINTVDFGGITLTNYGQEKYIISYTAYIYRSGDTPGIFSEVKGPHACLYRNGKDSPMEYSVTIPTSVSPRNVVVTLPFSHLYDTGKPANVKITAGNKVVESEFIKNNRGNYLRMETLTLEDVGGDVTEVIVSIFSQKVEEFSVGVSGANFITGPGLVTTTTPVYTRTQSYWKTPSEYGAVYPNPIINIATVSFTPAFDDIATVDLYNSLGQRTSRLMHQSVAKDIPFSFNFDSRQFNEGLYILMIQNGPGRESVKITISR